MNKKGQLIVVSGPSGVGKGTMLREYVKGRESVRYSVSATTRAPRPGEENGKDYYFLTKEEFLNRVEQGNILEYAQYNGNFYGTPKDMVEQALAQGQDIILEIDVQGALHVKEKSPGALLVFIMPPSGEELRQRLIGRQTEDEATINKRLAIAQEEMAQVQEYQYVVVNDNLDQAVAQFNHIVEANRSLVTNWLSENKSEYGFGPGAKPLK